MSYINPKSTKPSSFYPFFFNHTPTTKIYTLSLHDALPILMKHGPPSLDVLLPAAYRVFGIIPTRSATRFIRSARSEEHTSELQSRQYLVCRLLLEKKKCRARPGRPPPVICTECMHLGVHLK